MFLTSKDGVTWQLRNQDIRPPSSLKGVTFGLGQFVAVGDVGSLVVSGDGAKWETVSRKVADITGIAYGNGVHVAVGFTTSSLNILYSTNAINWVRANELKINRSLTSVAYGGGQFVAVGLAGIVCSSPDGRNWKRQAANLEGTPLDFRSIIYAEGTFFAVGSPGAIFTSSDGVAWVRQDSGTTRTILSIAYGNGVFVAGVGGPTSGGFVLTSQGGRIWVRRISGTENMGNEGVLQGVTYGDASFVAVGGSLITQSGMFTNGATLQKPQYSNGTFSAEVKGVVGQVWRLQAANELSTASWTNFSMVTNWISPVRFVERDRAASQRRFYRLVSP